MKNNWSNLEAKKYIKKYTKLGHSKDMALRVYTTRLLGRNSELVLHGGGNTSVKTSIKDIDGKNYEVLCVKGSGWDMAEIEPAGLPAVKLNPLLALKNKTYLSDEDMVAYQKRNLIDIKSPNPSVETFLHAFLPFKFVDHTHSDAIMDVTNRPNGKDLCKKIFGSKVSIVPYVMPGFSLAKKINDNESSTIIRKDVYKIQTPQLFNSQAINLKKLKQNKENNVKQKAKHKNQKTNGMRENNNII